MIELFLAIGVATVLIFLWIWILSRLFREDEETTNPQPRDWTTPGLCVALVVSGALAGAVSARSWEAPCVKDGQAELGGQCVPKQEFGNEGKEKCCCVSQPSKCEPDCNCGCHQGGPCECSEIIVGGWRLPCWRVCEQLYMAIERQAGALQADMAFLYGLEADWDSTSPGLLGGGGWRAQCLHGQLREMLRRKAIYQAASWITWPGVPPERQWEEVRKLERLLKGD